MTFVLARPKTADEAGEIGQRIRNAAPVLKQPCGGCGRTDVGFKHVHGGFCCLWCAFKVRISAPAKHQRRPRTRPVVVRFFRPVLVSRENRVPVVPAVGGRDDNGDRDDGGGGDGEGSDPPLQLRPTTVSEFGALPLPQWRRQ